MQKIPRFLCCFNSLKTNSIYILIIILSSIGIILNIIGEFVIPWGYSSKVMEILYIISLVLFGFSLFIPIFILCLRKKISNENLFIYCFSIGFIEIFACLFSIFANIFIPIGTIPDFKNTKRVVEISQIKENEKTTINNEQNLVSNVKLGFIIFLLIFNIILWILLLILWVSVMIRLKYKIKGTYNDYLNDQKQISLSTITKSSELNVIGHDKYGYPIYNNNHNMAKINYNYGLPNGQYFYNNKKNINEKETNNILRYSYKEKFTDKNGKSNCKSVEINQKIKKEQKEKYIEKYYDGAPIPYSNYENKTAINYSDYNNSINPRY